MGMGTSAAAPGLLKGLCEKKKKENYEMKWKQINEVKTNEVRKNKQ